MKTDFKRTPDGSQRIIDANLKILNAFGLPIFTGSPNLNDNPDEPGYVAYKNEAILLYTGTEWKEIKPFPLGGTSAKYLRGDGTWQTLNTAAVVEASNLYFTQARFDAAFGLKSTSDLIEGLNKYFTDARVQTFADTRYLQLTGGVLSGDVQTPALPLNANSLITRGYLENYLTGITWKQEVKSGSVANVNIASAPASMDGVAFVANDRLLLKNQTDQKQNGIWQFNGTGNALTRTNDADTSIEIGSATVLVRNGTVNKNTQWTCTNSVDPVIGTDNITFGQISGAGTYVNGSGIILTGNSFSVDPAYLNSLYVALTGSTSTGRQTIQLTSEQLRLAYDALNYCAFTVNSSGNLNIAPTGLQINIPSGTRIAVNEIVNNNASNNAKISILTTGVVVSRNIADANAALAVTQLNAASIGNILTLANSAGNVVEVSKAGGVKFNTYTSAGIIVNDASGNLSSVPVDSIKPNSGTILPNADWLDPASAGQSAPLVGGRIHQKVKRPIGVRALASFPTKADVYGNATLPALMAALSDDVTTDALYGSTALKVTSTPAVQVTVAPLTVNAVPTDVTNGSIRVMFKPISNFTLYVNKFYIELHSEGTPASPSSNFTRCSQFNTSGDVAKRLTSTNGVGRWQGYSVASAQFTEISGTGADMRNILFARFVFQTGTAAASIYLGNIDFIPNDFAKAKCILSFDDAFVGQYTYAALQMAKYGFPGVLHPSPAALRVGVNPLYLTAAQIKHMHDELGWQIASQGWTTEDQTTIDGWSEDTFASELSKQRNWQNTMGLSGGEHASYMSGISQLNMKAYPTYRKSYRSVRAFYNGNATGIPFVHGETLPVGDPLNIRSLNGGTWTTSTQNQISLKAHIDQAILNKGLAYITWHDELSTAGFVRDGFLWLLGYLDSLRSVIDVCVEQNLYHLTPVSKYDTDVEVTDLAKGIILKSPDGTRWRITIDNSGTLNRTSL